MEMKNSGIVPNNYEAGGRGLTGKVTLVVSPDNESGRFLIRSLAARGSDIVFVCLNGITQAVLHLQAEVEALGRRCLVMVGNLQSWRFSQLLMAQIIEVFGRLDVFIDFSAQEEETNAGDTDIFLPNIMMMTNILKQMVA